MLHVDEGSLHAYLDGELAGAERDSLLAHLAECPACRNRLEEERALVARAGELLGRAAPPKRAPVPFERIARPRAPRWRVPAAWAATVTIAFAMGWYAQAERLAHDLALSAIPSEAPPPRTASPRRADGRPATRPPVARAPAAKSLQAEVATAPMAAVPAALRDEGTASPALDADAARAVLGRAPAVLPGRAVLRMTRSPTDDGVVVIEQEWTPGIVLRLYERRAMTADRVDVAPTRAPSARAQVAPSAAREPRHEYLARYVNSLRIEIAGPLASDSLAQLLELVE